MALAVISRTFPVVMAFPSKATTVPVVCSESIESALASVPAVVSKFISKAMTAFESSPRSPVDSIETILPATAFSPLELCILRAFPEVRPLAVMSITFPVVTALAVMSITSASILSATI